jgi:hypothetical protein
MGEHDDAADREHDYDHDHRQMIKSSLQRQTRLTSY